MNIEEKIKVIDLFHKKIKDFIMKNCDSSSYSDIYDKIIINIKKFKKSGRRGDRKFKVDMEGMAKYYFINSYFVIQAKKEKIEEKDLLKYTPGFIEIYSIFMNYKSFRNIFSTQDYILFSEIKLSDIVIR